MRERLVLFAIFSSLLGIFVSSCASNGETTGLSEGASGVGSTASSSNGAGSTGSMTGASSSSASAGAGGAPSSSSSSSSGAGGEGGSPPDCSMGCQDGYVDADNNKATGVCGCEHNCTTGCPANQWNIDGNPLTGACGCEYACTQVSPTADPIDPAYKDDNCDGTDGVAEKCVYTSLSTGDDATGGGTRESPVKTIARAIELAGTNGSNAVCLSGDIYQEKVTMVSGISVYGGFDENDPDFKFRRSAKATTTVKSTIVGFTASKIDIDTHIEGLSIEVDAASSFGSNVYGVLLSGGTGQLFVRYNAISVGAAQDGAPGAAGQQPSAANAAGGKNGTAGAEENSNSGFGGAVPMCPVPGGKGGDGGINTAPGLDGSPGTGGTPGGKGATPNGCTPTVGSPGTPGDPGGNGTNGGPGTTGAGGPAIGIIEAGFYTPGHGKDGTPGGNGKAGGGGGGGGGGSDAFLCNWDKGGGGGSGGCGGVGGNQGAGGRGGGGSFAVFAAGGRIVVDGNEQLLAGDGGRGGKGGDSAVGQFGGPGGAGGNSSDDSGPGGKGGSGGNGASGAPGGGGGGGPSACLAFSVSAIAIYGSNSCSTGVPGLGGAGGTTPDGSTVANTGSNGKAGTKLLIN